MTTGSTALLSLALPVEGELDGTWGDVVNYGITDYVDIAVAGTLTLTGDGAITLVNTTGDNAGANIGATTAQYAVVKITGTLTTTKIITAPSTSKTYIVDNAATGGAVTFKALGQTGISVAVGEKCTVYFNGTDYVKVASSTTDGVSTIDFGSTGLTPNTATSGAVTVAGTLAIANGGTGTTSTTFANLTTNVTGTLPVANGGTGITSLGAGVATFLGTPSSANLASAVTDETGTGSLVFATSPTLVTPLLGTPTSGVLSNCTVDGTNAVGYLNIPQNVQTGSYTLTLGDAGEHIYRGSGSAATWTIPAASSVAYPIGTAITFINLSATAVSIAITTDTMYLSSAGTTGTRTLAQYGSATAIKISGVSSSGIWLISGSGLT
jgi:hypothetical protein